MALHMQLYLMHSMRKTLDSGVLFQVLPYAGSIV